VVEVAMQDRVVVSDAGGCGVAGKGGGF